MFSEKRRFRFPSGMAGSLLLAFGDLLCHPILSNSRTVTRIGQKKAIYAEMPRINAHSGKNQGNPVAWDHCPVRLLKTTAKSPEPETFFLKH